MVVIRTENRVLVHLYNYVAMCVNTIHTVQYMPTAWLKGLQVAAV